MQLVLVVDDDVLVRAASARALSKLPSIEVIEASGVAEATQLIRSLHIDLIVAAIELGDGTMLEVLPELAERGIPAVLVSDQAARFAQHLPSGLELHGSPMSPTALCQVVTAQLGCHELCTMFSLADYIQLASLGRRSLTLEVLRDSEPLGSVVILRGEAWSAHAPSGDGIAAFAQLIAESDATTTVAPAPRDPGARNLDGSCQRLLLEAARRNDEARAAAEASERTVHAGPAASARCGHISRPPAGASTVSPRRPAPVTSPVNGELPPIPNLIASGSVRTPRATSAAKPGDPGTEFEHLYALGVEALLAKRYREAFDTLSRASQIRTTASIAANLKRLREMGFE